MWDWIFPSKPPTPSEWAVLIGSLVILLILAGLAGLVMSFLAPQEKNELAIECARYGFLSLGAGLGIGVVLWIVRWSVD